MYLLPCKNCNEPIPVSTSQAGDEVTCKACQTTVQIPKLGELRQLPQTEETTETKAPKSSREGSVGSRIGFVLCGLLAMISLVSCVFCGISWIGSAGGKTTEKHIEEIREEYATLTPAVLVIHLEEMESRPIEITQPFQYHLEHQKMLAWKWRAIASLAAFIVFSALALVLVSSGKKPATA